MTRSCSKAVLGLEWWPEMKNRLAQLGFFPLGLQFCQVFYRLQDMQVLILLNPAHRTCRYLRMPDAKMLNLSDLFLS